MVQTCLSSSGCSAPSSIAVSWPWSWPCRCSPAWSMPPWQLCKHPALTSGAPFDVQSDKSQRFQAVSNKCSICPSCCFPQPLVDEQELHLHTPRHIVVKVKLLNPIAAVTDHCARVLPQPVVLTVSTLSLVFPWRRLLRLFSSKSLQGTFLKSLRVVLHEVSSEVSVVRTQWWRRLGP